MISPGRSKASRRNIDSQRVLIFSLACFRLQICLVRWYFPDCRILSSAVDLILLAPAVSCAQVRSLSRSVTPVKTVDSQSWASCLFSPSSGAAQKPNTETETPHARYRSSSKLSSGGVFVPTMQSNNISPKRIYMGIIVCMASRTNASSSRRILPTTLRVLSSPNLHIILTQAQRLEGQLLRIIHPPLSPLPLIRQCRLAPMLTLPIPIL